MRLRVRIRLLDGHYIDVKIVFLSKINDKRDRGLPILKKQISSSTFHCKRTSCLTLYRMVMLLNRLGIVS